MAINIEVKHLIRDLREEIESLKERVSLLEQKPAIPADSRKMCPKCGDVPAYHFHVKHCAGKKQKHGDESVPAPRAT